MKKKKKKKKKERKKENKLNSQIMFCTNLIMYDYAEIFLEIFAIFSKAIWSNLLEIMCLKGSFLHKLMESNCFFWRILQEKTSKK